MNGDSSGRLLAGEDPLQHRDSFVYTNLRDQLSFPYIARRNGVFVLLDPSLNDRNQRMAFILDPSAEGEYTHAFYFRMRREPQRADERLKLAIGEYPADGSLRAEFLRNWLGSLIRDQAAPDVTEIAAGADPRSQFMIEIMRHAFKSEWQDVARADDRLAEIAWSDPWYAEAAEMRINWRTHVMNPQVMKRYGEEAIAMIDRSCLLSPTLALYGLRARAGFNAAQPEIVVESVSAYAKLAGRMVRFHINPVDRCGRTRRR